MRLLSAERPIGKTLVCLGLLLAGWLAFTRMGVEALPNTDVPRILVNANLPGANPSVVAKSLIAPLERYIGQVSGIEAMYSSSAEGEGFIQVSFQPSVNIDRAARKLEQAIAAAGPALPSGMTSPPSLYKFNSADGPLLLLSITSKNLSRDALYELADKQLAPYIAQIPGVAKVETSGGSAATYCVRLNTGALYRKGVTSNDVANVLRAQDVLFPIGSLQQGDSLLTLSINDGISSLQELSDLVVAQRGERIVRLSDVATMSREPANPANLAWHDGAPSIMMLVARKSGTNALATTARIKEAVDRFQRGSGHDVRIETSFDLSRATRSAVREVLVTLLGSALCVFLVTFLFVRRMAQTIIIAITIPLSIAVTLIVMYAIGYSINMLTLLSLVLCIGFVVDDAIVMVENITRHVERGDSPLQAAIASVRELRFTLVCMTVSLIAAMLPILAGNSEVFIFLRQFSVTLSVAVAVSLIVSLFFAPAFCARHVRSRGAPPARQEPAGAVTTPGRAGALAWVVDWMLARRRYFRAMPIVMAAAIFMLYHAVLSSAGAAYMPVEDTGLVQVQLDGLAGSAPQVQQEELLKAQDIVRADPAVKTVVALSNGSQAQLFVDLLPKGSGPGQRSSSIKAVVDRLADHLGELRRSNAFVNSASFLGDSDFAGAQPSKAPFSIELLSYDGSDLRPWLEKLAGRLMQEGKFKQVSTDFDSHALDYQVAVDRPTASRLGISMAAVDAALFNAFGKQVVTWGEGREGGESIVLSSAQEQAGSPDVLLNTYVRSDTGIMVPMSAFARVLPSQAERSIIHQNQIEAGSVYYDLASGMSSEDASELLMRIKQDIGLPKGIRVRDTGEAARIAAVRSNGVMLVCLALLAIFITLGMLYESLLHPLTIMSSLPAAGAGAFLAMWMTQTKITTISLVALILLVGVAKKNTIILVDFALMSMRERGLDPVPAIREACLVRFRPMAMTTLVAIGSSMPLVLALDSAGDVQRPLGIAIVGGLAISQLFAFFTTPAVFLLSYDWRMGRDARSARRRAFLARFAHTRSPQP